MTTERLTCIYVPIYVPVLQVDLIEFGSLEVEVKAKSTADKNLAKGCQED